MVSLFPIQTNSAELIIFLGAARNTKFRCVSLACCMETGAPMSFMRDEFMVELCTGETKLFFEPSDWELMDLRPEPVFDILE